MDEVGPQTLAALIEHLPQDSAVMRAVYGPDASLTYADHMARLAVYELRVANWQRAGDKNAKKPQLPELPSQLEARDKGTEYKQQLVRRLRDKLRRKGGE